MSRYNQFFFIRTFWGAMRHTDWKAAARRGSIFGLIAEFFRALTGLNAWPFFIPANSGWTPEAITSILQEYGIPYWGIGKHNGEFFFQVRLQQASWAQYLLMQNGVPIAGRLIAESPRSGYVPRGGNLARPTPNAPVAQNPFGAFRPAPQPARQNEAPVSIFSDPVGQINRAVDRLAKW